MRKRWRNSIPLMVYGPLLLALPVTLAALIVGAIGYLQGSGAVDRLTQQNLEQVHGRIADHLTSLMSMPPEVVSLNIGLLDDRRLDPADLHDWIQPLYQQARAFPLLSSLSWETIDGKAIWIARYPGDSQLVLGLKDKPDAEMVEYVLTDDGQLPAESWRSFAYDPREWGPYQTAEKSTKPMWAEPVDWVDEQGNVTAMALPYVSGWRDADGRFHGAVTGQFTLNDLSEFLASLPVSDMTESYVTDQADRLLGTSMTTSELEHLVASTAVANPLIAGSAMELQKRQAASIASPWEGRLEVDGTGYLTRVSSWQHPTGLRLRIITLTPEKRIMAEISQARQLSVFAGLATAGWAALVGMALAVRLLRPVLAVQRHVARVGAGDFDTPLELTLSPEFVELSTAINQMSADLKDREALRRSLSMAMQVQQSLLPSRLPEVAGIDIAAHSAFCDQTGGDYYDFLDLKGLGPGELAIVVGDVMGHGIAAAMLMATARGALHTQAQHSGEPNDLLRHLNELLADVTEGYQFMTMLTVVIDPARRRLRWASAGHGEPLVFDPVASDFVPLEGGSLPLGVESGEVFEQYSFDDLRPGMILIAATDGLWEARRPDGEQFGMQRIRQLLRDHASQDAQRITAAIVEALAAFVGGQPSEDDVTFVIARIVRDTPR